MPERRRQNFDLDDITPERFWTKVQKGQSCWEWLGSKTPNGYAQFHVRLRDGRWSSTVGHRIAYEWEHGLIPDGVVLDHLCRNRGCVNPAHLEAVDDRTNILRGTGFAARHARKTHCPAGHPYSEKHSYIDKRGMRHCRTCDAIRQRAARLRRRASHAGTSGA